MIEKWHVLNSQRIQIPKFEPRPSHPGRQSENATFVTIVIFYRIQTLVNNQHNTAKRWQRIRSKTSEKYSPASPTAKDSKDRKADYVTLARFLTTMMTHSSSVNSIIIKFKSNVPNLSAAPCKVVHFD